MSADPGPSEEKGQPGMYFRHNLWANLNLFNACLSLTNTQLGHTDPGTYGSIEATLAHLVRSEERYLFFLTGQETPDDGTSDTQNTVAGLRERVVRSGQALIQAAESVQPNTQVQVGEGEKTELVLAAIVLLQAIYHSSEHRTHVATLLGQLGIKPPPLSGWDFYDQEILGIMPGES
ncbi:MAG: DinB family protein [Bacteroidota bacterium]